MSWLGGLLDWVLGWFASSESKLVKAVRESTVLLCGFLPTVETVVALVAVQNPAVITAMGIARKICAAVTSAQKVSGLMSAPIIVDGVVIEGDFVGKE